MKIKKILSAILILALVVISVVACGKKEEETTAYKITTFKNVKNLQRGCYYVEQKDGTFAAPYWGEHAFKDTEYTSASTSKVVWYQGDWDCIPTVYKDEYVIFRTDADFKEEFYFEKFLDLGYTLGVCNMKQTDTGRYKFSTDMSEGQICSYSSASSLSNLGGANVTFEAILGQKIRSNCVSQCGTITGLTKNKTYKAQLYVGTELKSREIKADVRALYSAQVNKTTDYEFIESEIIKIKIPSYFNSGYYSVNGSGIFRYVNGNNYTEDMEMNEMNVSSADAVGLPDIYFSADLNENITLEDGEQTITLTYDDNVNPDLVTNLEQVGAPIVTIELDDEIVEFEDIGDNKLQAHFTAKRGIYAFTLEGMYGRGYQIAIEKASSSEEPETEEVAP